MKAERKSKGTKKIVYANRFEHEFYDLLGDLYDANDRPGKSICINGNINMAQELVSRGFAKRCGDKFAYCSITQDGIRQYETRMGIVHE